MIDPLLSPEEIETLTDVFRAQAAELLEDYSRLVLALETEEDPTETLRGIKRIVHTMKGDSMALDFDEVTKIAHQIEDLLGDSRVTELINDPSQSSELIDLLLRGGDAMGRLVAPDSKDAAASTTMTTPTDLLLDQFERLRGDSEPEPNIEAQRVELLITFADECAMRSVGSFLILQRLEPLGEIVLESPESNSKDIESTKKWRIQLLSSASKDALRSAARVPGVAKRIRIRDLSDVDLTATETTNSTNGSNRPNAAARGDSTEPTAAKRRSDENETNRGGEKTPERDRPSHTEHLRVEVAKIDRIMNLVGELVLARSMLSDGLRSGLRTAEPGERLYDATQLLDSTLRELQAAVLQTRMVPIDQVFRRFPRLVREVTRLSNKQVELAIEGADTEIDKSIADRIGEPLLHLLRNAVDHGIETPEERESAGKSRSGKLRLSASCEANQVHIELSDDGRGIDPQLIGEKALSKGLVSEADLAEMDAKQKLDLIYRSGFSTKHEVSLLSGRGVGMDVAASMVESLDGSIDCVTQLGVGSRFMIRLPLTLSIARALIVRVEDRSLAIPLTSVSEIVRLSESESQSVLGRKVLSLRGDVVPLVDLCEALSLSRQRQKPSRAFVLIVDSGNRKHGLVVDEVHGEHELVVKPFEDPLVKSPGIAGGSVMGDGSIVLIVDIRGILNSRHMLLGAVS